MIRRRSLFALPLLAAAPTEARAQSSFPNRTIEMIVPVAVAGGTDIVGRILAEAMAPMLGKPVVVENIAGADGTIGATVFELQPADGNTLYIANNNHAVMRAMYPAFRYDPVKNFKPLSLVSKQPFMLVVNPEVPAHSVQELVVWLRQQRTNATFGASQPGASNYMAGQMFRQLTGTDFTIVPYRGAAAATQDLAAGRLNFTIDSPSVLAPLVSGGMVRPLAVTSAKGSDLLPGLPSIQQGGVKGYDMLVWTILFARVGTPPEAAGTLQNVAARALALPSLQQRFKAVFCEVWPDNSPAAAEALLKSEVAKWAPIVKESLRQVPS